MEKILLPTEGREFVLILSNDNTNKHQFKIINNIDIYDEQAACPGTERACVAFPDVYGHSIWHFNPLRPVHKRVRTILMTFRSVCLGDPTSSRKLYL